MAANPNPFSDKSIPIVNQRQRFPENEIDRLVHPLRENRERSARILRKLENLGMKQLLLGKEHCNKLHKMLDELINDGDWLSSRIRVENRYFQAVDSSTQRQIEDERTRYNDSLERDKSINILTAPLAYSPPPTGELLLKDANTKKSIEQEIVGAALEFNRKVRYLDYWRLTLRPIRMRVSGFLSSDKLPEEIDADLISRHFTDPQR